MNIFLTILAVIGLLLVLAIVWFFVRRWLDQKQDAVASQPWPPEGYMKTVGSKCPDYWVYEGVDPKDPNKIICRNAYNIPIQDKTATSEICADSPDYNKKTFTDIKEWPPKTSEESVKERCAWISQCGPAPKIKGSWIGMHYFC